MQINWIAKDEDGKVYGYEDRPERATSVWTGYAHELLDIELPGLWEESLRPYGELRQLVASARSQGSPHYTAMTVQPWDVIDTWPIEQRIGFYRGNLLKYTMRMGAKDAAPQEIEKAEHYAKKLLEVLK